LLKFFLTVVSTGAESAFFVDGKSAYDIRQMWERLCISGAGIQDFADHLNQFFTPSAGNVKLKFMRSTSLSFW
jgi:hypothetical protein